MSAPSSVDRDGWGRKRFVAARGRAAATGGCARPARERSAAEAEQLCDRDFVGGREGVVLELVALHPREVVHVALARGARREVALVEVEVDDVALVRVAHEADELADTDADAEAVQYFALEGGAVALA